MFDQGFFTGKVGTAALVSIVAMVAFNVYALASIAVVPHDLLVVSQTVVELA